MKPTRLGRRLVLTASAYAALGLVMAWPLPLRLLSAIPGDGFDGWQNYWNLWWVRRALLELGTSPWHTTMLDYPAGVSLYFHTLNIPNGVLALPVQELMGLVPAYNAVVMASFALGGVGTYLLALRAIGRRDSLARASAFVAGMIFALSPFHFAHLLGHMQVFAFQWLPFYCLALLGLLKRTSPSGSRRGAYARPEGALARYCVTSLFLVLAALTDWYNLLYLGLLTVLWALWHGRRWRRDGLRSLCRPWLAALGVGGVALAALSPLLLPMVIEASRASYMVTGQWELPWLSSDLVAFVLPQEMHPLWGRWAKTVADGFTASTSERMIFLGFAPLLMGLVAWWRGGERSRLFVWTGLCFGVLALGPVLHIGGRVVAIGGRAVALPYLLLYNTVPFMGIARSVGRFSVMAVLAVAVLAGMGLLHLSRRLGRLALGLPALAGLVVCIEFLPAPYPMSAPDTPSWYRQLAQEGNSGAVLNLPVNWDRPQYLLYQTVHGKPLVSGYTSRRNPLAPVEQYPGLQQLRALDWDVLAFPDARTFATIAQDLRLRYVVLDSYQMPGGDERRRTLALAQRLLAGQDVVHQDERITVYRLRAPAENRAAGFPRDERRPYARLIGAWGAREEGKAGPSRRPCRTCGFAIGGPDTAATLLAVRCSEGAQARVELSAGSVISIGDILPRCSALRRAEIASTREP